VPKAVTEDTETPSGSPFATLLDDADTDRSEAEASVFGSSAESSNQGVSVTPKRAQKPKGSTRKSSRERGKQTAASKRTPGTGSSRKRRNDELSSEQFIAISKQHELQPTPKKLKERRALESEANDVTNEADKSILQSPGTLSTTVVDTNKDKK